MKKQLAIGSIVRFKKKPINHDINGKDYNHQIYKNRYKVMSLYFSETKTMELLCLDDMKYYHYDKDRFIVI